MPAGPRDCEYCEHWSPNTVGRIMGWCLKEGPKPLDPLLTVLGSGRRSYQDSCHLFASPPHAKDAADV